MSTANRYRIIHKMYILSFISVAIVLFCSSCAKKKEYGTEPLIGLSWYMEREAVEEAVSELTFIGERESNGMTLLDYSGAKISDIDVCVTFCFKDDCLVGIDYHDKSHKLGYLKWMTQIEDVYGIPNENALTCASWFDKTIDEDISIYLFDLDSGVQISFFCTDDTPDRNFDNRLELERRD